MAAPVVKKMDQKFIDKAKLELREDEFRKSQSLAQFRDWLSKHPFLSGVRQGEKFTCANKCLEP